MKRRWLILMVLLLFMVPSVFSLRVYFLPIKTVVFDPGLKFSNKYTFANNLDKTINVRPYVEGELAEYVTLSETYVEKVRPGESFPLVATLTFPKKNNLSGGIHKVIVGAVEERLGSSGIGARGAAGSNIYVRVRYPGKHIQGSLETQDIQAGKKADFKVKIFNSGSDRINQAWALIDIFDEKGKKTKTLKTEIKSLEIDKDYVLLGSFDTKGYKKGEYSAQARVYYDGQNLTTNKDIFRIGDISIKINSHTKRAYVGTINPFDITISSEWNYQIKDIYAQVKVMNQSKLLSTFKTPNYALNAWEIKNMSTYFDATGFEPGDYQTNVTLFYAGKEESVSGQLKVVRKAVVQEPFFANQTNLLLTGAIVLLVVINLLWFIFFKLRKKKED